MDNMHAAPEGLKLLQVELHCAFHLCGVNGDTYLGV
jgi:hypothetical protein